MAECISLKPRNSQEMSTGRPFYCIISYQLIDCVADIVTLLLEYGAPIKVKNSLGWSPMSEAVSYGDRQISMCVLCVL